MKTILACILVTSVAVGQEFSLSSGYHLYSTGSSLGVAASTNLMT